VALFPDAPTKRGSRHLRTLISSLAQGRASVAFVIQRDDASTLRPNEATDPVFAETIREAERKGVEVYAYSSNVTLEGITIKKRVQVNL
jgi:sugar fermentation stimulation protein A